MTDKIFSWCVDILVNFAELLGLTYNEINVYIFVIITPLIFLIMLVIIITQQIKIKNLNKQIKIEVTQYQKMKNLLPVIIIYLLLASCSYKEKSLSSSYKNDSLSDRFMQHFSVELDAKSVDLINYKGGCTETFVIEFNSQEYYKEIFEIIAAKSIWETPNNKERNIQAIEEGTLWNEDCIDCNSKKIKDLKRTNYMGNSINHRAIFYDDNTVEFVFSDCW